MKVIKDPVHDYIELHPAAVLIVDTPEFQRLRDLGQLGGVYYVFAGATGKRFEHSLGVAHLARCFVRQLRQRQPELAITDADELCVHLAGLCHDLGHGPFSHLFDGRFIHEIRARADPPLPPWDHEHASVAMLDHLIAANGLGDTLLEKHGLTPHDVHFIQELVLGAESDAPPGFEWVGADGREERNAAFWADRASSGSSSGSDSSSSSSSSNSNNSNSGAAAVAGASSSSSSGGRVASKEFLYDIVANHRSGIDVDKFDYFARDCHQLGIQKTFDAERLMRNARVLEVSEAQGWRVCFDKKEAWNVYELFHTRYSLHKRAYQHRVATVVEHMFCEALMAADDVVTLQGDPSSESHRCGAPPEYRLSECIEDMSAYAKLSDWIIYRIQHSTEPSLARSRELVRLIRTRRLYAFVGEVIDQTGGQAGGAPPLRRRERERVVKEELLEAAARRREERRQQRRRRTCRNNNRNRNRVSVGSGSGSGGSVGGEGDNDDGNGNGNDNDGNSNDGEGDEDVEVTSEDLLVCVVDISYGKGNQNPVDHTHFFAKTTSASSSNSSSSSEMAVGLIQSDRVSLMVPRVFSERFVRVWCRQTDRRSPKVAAVRDAFEAWQEDSLGQPALPITPVSNNDGRFSGGSPRASPLARPPLNLPLAEEAEEPQQPQQQQEEEEEEEEEERDWGGR